MEHTFRSLDLLSLPKATANGSLAMQMRVVLWQRPLHDFAILSPRFSKHEVDSYNSLYA